MVRLSAMGDILHALPAVTALRETHPEWRIGWAVEPQWKPLLAAEGATARGPAMPLVDRVHVVPARQWTRSPLGPKTMREVRRVRRELREEKYDVCVDLQGALRSAVIAKWARAKRLIGEDAPRERVARYFFNERVRTSGVHVIEQAMEVMNAVAEERLSACRALLPRDAEAECKASALAAPFALLIPGAGWGAKRWPAERYAELATRLRDAGYSVVVNCRAGRGVARGRSGNVKRRRGNRASVTIAELIAVTRRGRAGDRRRHGAAASGVRAGEAGGGNLRPDRPGAQRAVRRQVPRAAAPREQARPHAARSSGSGAADHYAGVRHGRGMRAFAEEQER